MNEPFKLSEQEPSFDEPVLLFSHEQELPIIGRLTSVTIRKGSKGYSFLEGEIGYGDLYVTVTGWMPLPKNPFYNKKAST